MPLSNGPLLYLTTFFTETLLICPIPSQFSPSGLCLQAALPRATVPYGMPYDMVTPKLL